MLPASIPPSCLASSATAIRRALTVAVARTAQLARITHRLNVRSAVSASTSASAYCCASSTGPVPVRRAASLGAEVLSCSACSRGNSRSSPGLPRPMIPAASNMSSRDLNAFMAWFLRGERDHPTIDRCDERGDTLDVRNQIRARHGEHRGCRRLNDAKTPRNPE